MRTTIDLPEPLFRRAKAQAAIHGIPLKDLVTKLLDQGLKHSPQVPASEARRRRSELPVAREAVGKPLPILSNADLHKILEAEDVHRERDF